jgi:hypothetical protein
VVMIHQRFSLRLWLSLGIDSVLTKGIFDCAESPSRLNSLRKRLLLHLLMMVIKLFLFKFVLPVIGLWHMLDNTTESSAFTNLSLLGRISQEVTRLSWHRPIVILNLLLNFFEISQMIKVGFNFSLNGFGRFEIHFMTSFFIAVLFGSSHWGLCCFFEGISNSCVGWLRKQYGINVPFLYFLSCKVSWFSYNCPIFTLACDLRLKVSIIPDSGGDRD